MILASDRHVPRKGQALAIFVIQLVFLVGMVAFAIDTGYIAATRTQMQGAADSGALAGADKLPGWPGQAVPAAAAKAEALKFVGLNEALTVRDEDVRLLRYNPMKPVGQRLTSAYSVASPPNAFEITLRRDSLANGQLPLFFAPMLGQQAADVRVKSMVYVPPAKGIKAGAPLLPYTMQVDYYFACVGQQRIGVDGKPITVADNYTVRSSGSVVSEPDGVFECVLFSSKQNAPGNFGSVDIGSGSNGTPELERQILNGPTTADFQQPDFRDKVAADGALYAPVSLGGDPGVSAATKSAFEQILGQGRIIPLYDTVSGNGNNTSYHVVGFAAVTVVAVDFQGSPKRLWIQPTKVVTNKATPGDIDAPVTFGVHMPAKFAVP